MKKLFFAMATISIASSGCASERLRVTVTDSEGLPISNATVNVSFTSGHVVFGKGKPHHYMGKTGMDGRAVVKFNCASSDVHWAVEANGYYPSDFHKEVFRIEVIQIPPHLLQSKHARTREGREGDTLEEEKSSTYDCTWRGLRGRRTSSAS